MKSSNYSGNGNGKRNTNEEKNHSRTNMSDSWLNVETVAESYSGCFFSNRRYLEIDRHGQKGWVESDLRRKLLKSSREEGPGESSERGATSWGTAFDESRWERCIVAWHE